MPQACLILLGESFTGRDQARQWAKSGESRDENAQPPARNGMAGWESARALSICLQIVDNAGGSFVRERTTRGTVRSGGGAECSRERLLDSQLVCSVA